MKHLLRRFAHYFLMGIAVLMPILLTIYIVWNLFLFIDNIFKPVIVSLTGIKVYGMGFILTLVFIVICGFLTQNFLGRKIFQIFDKIFRNLPLIKVVYSTLKEISDAVFSRGNRSFKKVVIIEYPKADCYSIAFLTNENFKTKPESLNGNYSCVFVPTTPNPTSGYMLILPKEKIIEVDMDVQTAMRFIISAGVVQDQSSKN